MNPQVAQKKTEDEQGSSITVYLYEDILRTNRLVNMPTPGALLQNWFETDEEDKPVGFKLWHFNTGTREKLGVSFGTNRKTIDDAASGTASANTRMNTGSPPTRQGSENTPPQKKRDKDTKEEANEMRIQELKVRMMA